MKFIPSISRTGKMLAALVLGILLSPMAFAHGGEDHGAATVQAPHALAPRAEAKSEEIEMLAVYGNKALTLYLSQFRTNDPITGAVVEIESGSNKAVAKPAADGTYQAEAPWLGQPGKHGLVVTVQGSKLADLLETTLEIPQVATASQPSAVNGFTPAGLIGSLGAAALVGFAVFVARRRKK